MVNEALKELLPEIHGFNLKTIEPKK